jgi:hypothetical protein
VAETEPIREHWLGNIHDSARPLGLYDERIGDLDAGVRFGNDAGEFMAKGDWIIALPTLFASILVQTTTTDGRGLHLEQTSPSHQFPEQVAHVAGSFA